MFDISEHSMRVGAIPRGRVICPVLLENTCPRLVRRYSTPILSSEAPAAASLPIDPRWLSSVKQRLGKCITFGLTSERLDEAGNVLQQLASSWTELLAGSEGYLTGPARVGLYKQAVVWGEMVRSCPLNLSSLY